MFNFVLAEIDHKEKTLQMFGFVFFFFILGYGTWPAEAWSQKLRLI